MEYFSMVIDIYISGCWVVVASISLILLGGINRTEGTRHDVTQALPEIMRASTKLPTTTYHHQSSVTVNFQHHKGGSRDE
jgi:hypothetical protein